ncbi:hypothetical protein FHW12_000331 [Dokdonella fugitiva]|uniref:Uncharacterized protein n=1 Tax=Dokdonella fugitiva TaxID=328517 RepID=A0A839EZ01_9GAMM|nr:hypothetical protein [Dokdonella fugitiva]MBA8886140.1 hypothetical protein [Dokdonella fugitiva]
MNDTDRSKLGLAILVIVLATLLRWQGGLIDGAQWVAVVSATTWAFMVGQVGAIVAQGYAVQTAAKAVAIAKGVAAAGLLLISATAFAQQLEPNGLFSDGFDVNAWACSDPIAPDGVPRTRLVLSDVDYSAQHWPVRYRVAMTEWDNVWGHNSATDAVTPWPGVAGSAPTLRWFRRTSYVALHFRTPVDPFPGLASRFVAPSANAGPNLTMAISRGCGDFRLYLPTPGCLAENVPTADVPMVYWQFADTSPATACNLQPDTDYFVNIMQTDPTSTLECTTVLCPAAAWRN